MKAANKNASPGQDRWPVILVMILSLLCSYSPSFGQDNDAEWVPGPSQNGVHFYYKTIDCNGENTALIKVSNENPGPVTIAWQEEFVIDGETLQTTQPVNSMFVPNGDTSHPCDQAESVMVTTATELSRSGSMIEKIVLKNIIVIKE
jgi:hypothetical protein